ncbi:hypothetical protein ACMFMG_001124 [Clarireedia jacksonii]
MNGRGSNSKLSRHQVQEIMMRYGIAPKTATNVAMNELNGWPVEEVEEIMKKIKRPKYDYCPLKVESPDSDDSFLRRCGNWILPNAWVKPPLELIRQSVREKLILCVNKSFDWKLMNGNYMAVSHVWAEGIRADSKGRGLTREHLSCIFERIAKTGAEWIWLDVLSVPNADPAGENLTQEEKDLQIDVINTLPDVYAKAEAVIVLDALLLQMHTESPIDVAVGLVCGAWTKRVWTYQEIRLAKKALFVTAEKIYSLDDIRSELNFRVNLFESLNSEPNKKSQFESLKLSMEILQYVGNIGLSLTDISFASTLRQSTYDLDYARALFALLGLEWEKSWTSAEQGMQKIFETRKKHAAHLVAMHGAKRMTVSPRWAPSRLSGLEGRINSDMTWESTGVRGLWYKDKITNICYHFFRGSKKVFNLELEGLVQGSEWCQVILSEDEEEKTIEDFIVSIKNEDIYMLCQHRISENHGFERGTSSHALVVRQAISTGEQSVQEVDVLFSVALSGVIGSSIADQVTLVLRH